MKWLIWSIEHNAWWRANGNGYTKVQSEAGRYEFDAARKEVEDANHGLRTSPDEAMCPDWRAAA